MKVGSEILGRIAVTYAGIDERELIDVKKQLCYYDWENRKGKGVTKTWKPSFFVSPDNVLVNRTPTGVQYIQLEKVRRWDVSWYREEKEMLQ